MRNGRNENILRAPDLLRFQPPNLGKHNIAESRKIRQLVLRGEDPHRRIAHSDASAEPALLVWIPHAEEDETSQTREDALDSTPVSLQSTVSPACTPGRWGFDLVWFQL
jgi:hypothetical protein